MELLASEQRGPSSKYLNNLDINIWLFCVSGIHQGEVVKHMIQGKDEIVQCVDYVQSIKYFNS